MRKVRESDKSGSDPRADCSPCPATYLSVQKSISWLLYLVSSLQDCWGIVERAYRLIFPLASVHRPKHMKRLGACIMYHVSYLSCMVTPKSIRFWRAENIRWIRSTSVAIVYGLS